MGRRGGRATISDVAERAGVSRATVSRALSGSRPMSPELAERVQRAARELGYTVNLVGRALRKQRTSVVGLLVPNLDNPFFASLAEHLSRVVEASDIEILVASAGESVRSERRLVESFLGRQVDALVVMPCDESASREALELAIEHVVTVQLDRKVLASGAYFVGCDNVRGMELIAEHVRRDVDTARQPVTFVGAEPRSSSAHERLAEFRRHFPDRPTILGSFDSRSGARAADEVLDAGATRGTFVAAADVIAVGLLSRLHARGVSVPDDFRVVGFDGIGVTSLAHPELTTVRQPVEEMSRVILDLVSRADDTGEPARDIRLAPSLVVGPSSPTRT